MANIEIRDRMKCFLPETRTNTVFYQTAPTPTRRQRRYQKLILNSGVISRVKYTIEHIVIE
jgi:hypothetical protein